MPASQSDLNFMFSKTALGVYTKMANKVAGWISGADAAVVKDKVESVVSDYSAGAQYLSQNRGLFIKTLVVSAVQILALFSIPFVVFKSFGLTGYSAFQIIGLQAVLYNSINFLPIPGAVGSSEGMFFVLFHKIFTHKYIGTAMLLSRCLSFYLWVLICGLSVIVFTRKFMIRALAGAGIVGNIIKTNASISGAECGCQAEIGSACSMAAAGLAELFCLDMDQIEYAAEVAMEHHLGLTCDPINGLVQIP